MNNFFNKIYIISSYDTKNRLSELIPFLKNEGIDVEIVIAPKKEYFIPDFSKTCKSKGAFSHISAAESIFLKESFLKSDTFCIMEDDIFFADDYINKLNLFFSKLSDDWEILNLGFHEYNNFKSKTSNLFYKLKTEDRICGAHIVAYKNKTVPFLIDKLNICEHPMDWFLCDHIYPNFNTYLCLDNIFYGSSYRENENNKHLYYKKYESSLL
jgi:hypothetical protein